MTPRTVTPRSQRSRAFVLPAISTMLLALASAPAAAQSPSPLDQNLWSFPGGAASPGSAQSAAVALADRWLGSPFDQPAARVPRGIVATGLVLRTSRQDLRAENRSFQEQAAVIDFGGAWLSLGFRVIDAVVYAYQPVLRIEDNAFTRGQPGGPVQPAVVLSNGSSREQRAGLALSRGFGTVRLGVAGEWQHRSDVYEYDERSGSPDQGTRHLDFSGGTWGAQAGVIYGEDRPERGAFTLGVATRILPTLTLDGEQRFDLLSGDSLAAISAERESAIEAGVSASVRATGTLRVVAGVGTRTAREWIGLGVRSGRALQWSVGGEFHDPRDPWTLRFGAGQEREDDIAERRSGLVGLGIGWHFDRSRLDVGLLHRTIDRAGLPKSYDDRVAATVTANF